MQTTSWLTASIMMLSALISAQSIPQDSIEHRAHTPIALTGQPRSAPLPHLYWHFLMYQIHLDRAASDHERQGKDGRWLAEHLQKRIGFSDADFAIVRQSAQRLDLQLKNIHAKAKSIFKTDRALYANQILNHDTPPPGLAQLKDLHQQREDVINAEIIKLNAELGPQNAARLKNFVEKELFAQSPAIHRIPPRPFDQKRYGTHRSNTEVQQ